MIRTTRPSHNFHLLHGPPGCMPQLMFSFSLDQLQIDGHTFLRYLKLLAYHVLDFSVEEFQYDVPPPYDIRPVALRPSVHPDLTGYLECVGGPVCLDEQLIPGCFALYDPVEGRLYDEFIGNGKSVPTIEYRFKIPGPVFDVGERDAAAFVEKSDPSLVAPSKCVITGSTEGVELNWIYPPAAFGSKYESLHNIIPLARQVREYFYRNDFGIDVDDNYRVVKFTSIPSSVGLPEFLVDEESYLRDKHDFFRGHFRHCLRVYMSGSSIVEDEQIMPMNPEDYDWFAHELYLKLWEVSVSDSCDDSDAYDRDSGEREWSAMDEDDGWARFFRARELEGVSNGIPMHVGDGYAPLSPVGG